MNLNQDKKFLICLAAAAFLGTAYWAVNYLSAIKTTNAKPLSLQKTRKILQQIKYQILTTCTTFVQGLKNKPKTSHLQQDLEIFYRSELAKVYEMRQENSLNKYVVTRDQYASSLNHYKNDPQIKKGQQEIIEMLQRATKSIYPNYTVPQQASNLLTQEQVVQVYLEMCELISVKVWQKLDQQTRMNPGFNSKDDAHFKKAVRQLSIYDIKVEFLKKKGFQATWGCPNEVFFKVMESIKQTNKQIKNKAAAIDKAYEKAIDKITKQPENLNAERIKFLFEENLNEKAPEKPVPQALPNIKAPLINSVQNPPKRVATAKKDDEFNMDELMLQQLMSRSQEEPKQEKKIEVTKEVPIKIVEIPAQKKEQREELAGQVKIVDQVSVPVNSEVIQTQLQDTKVLNEGNELVAEEIHSTVIVQFQQKSQQIKLQTSIQDVKYEEANQKEIHEEKVQAQQTLEVLPAEQPESRQE